MPQPLVSVIIPTRNRRELVVRAVDSVLRQTFQSFEIIVVDDGSTDGTAGALAGRDRCLVLSSDPRGPAAARNVGIAAASGELLAFLDSDDQWLGDHLASLVEPFRSEAVGLAYTPTRTVSMDGEPLGGRRDRRKCYSGRAVEPLFRHIFIHTSNVVCRTGLVRCVGGFDESMPVCEDYHLWLRLALRSELAHVNRMTAIRCWHPQALSRQDRVRNAVVRAAMLERFYLVEGGREAIPAHAAARRLGKVFYQAGRALSRTGQWADAARFFARSLRYRPAQLRGYGGYLRCCVHPSRPQRPGDVQRLLAQLAWSI